MNAQIEAKDADLDELEAETARRGASGIGGAWMFWVKRVPPLIDELRAARLVIKTLEEQFELYSGPNDCALCGQPKRQHIQICPLAVYTVLRAQPQP